jgi:hypothetical protein
MYQRGATTIAYVGYRGATLPSVCRVTAIALHVSQLPKTVALFSVHIVWQSSSASQDGDIEGILSSGEPKTGQGTDSGC